MINYWTLFEQEVSKEFCENIVNAKILDLRDNQIEELPEEIAMLQKLIRLDLTNNSLTKLVAKNYAKLLLTF